MSDRVPIAIVGAGLMGCGIAQVFAVAGHQVALYDAVESARLAALARIGDAIASVDGDASAMARIALHADLAGAVCGADFVIEAAPENLELKQRLFQQIEAAARPQAILASNTSVIPITAIMAKLRDKSRALGTHWWNPPYLVPLVEVVRTIDTSDAASATTLALLRAVGKSAVEVKKDIAGFVGNRLQHALWREAIALVNDGVCDAETVDMVVKASFGRRLAVLGPLENADLVGTDLTLAIHQYVLPHLEASGAPAPILEKLVASGKLGFKSGEGFRRWTQDQQTALRRRVTEHLKMLGRVGV